jgi:hypothetical protein
LGALAVEGHVLLSKALLGLGFDGIVRPRKGLLPFVKNVKVRRGQVEVALWAGNALPQPDVRQSNGASSSMGSSIIVD